MFPDDASFILNFWVHLPLQVVCGKTKFNGYFHHVFCKRSKRNIKIDMPKLNSSWVVQAVSWDTRNAGFWHILTEQEIEPWFLPLPAE